MTEIEYKISLYPARSHARWNINKDKGNIILYITNIWWQKSESFENFVEWCIFFILLERICLERAYNKIRIKGGRCNPCCVEKIAHKIYELY